MKQASPQSLMKLATPLMIGRGISAALTFTIPIILARHLPRGAYGTYKQFFLIAATTYLIGQLGFTASLYYFLPRAKEDAGRYYMQAMIGLTVVGLGAGAAVLGGAGLLARGFSNPALVGLAVPLAIYVAAYLGAAPLELALTATKRTGWAGLSYALSDLARTAALTAPIATGLGMHGLAWCAAGFALLRLVVAWIVALSGALLPTRAPSVRTLREQLRYSLPFAGAVLLATVQMQFPQYAVSALTDAATYAIYAVGILQIPLTDMLYTPVAEVMMVRLAASREDQVPSIFGEAVARLAIFFLPLAAFVLAAAPVLVPWLYTSRYAASVPIFMIAVCEVPLMGLPVDGLLRSLDATSSIFGVNALRLVFTLAAVPAGLVLLGLPGAMLGYVTTQWLAKMLLLRAASRRLKTPIRALLPWPELISWGARALVIFGAVCALRVFGPWHGVRFVVAATGLAGVLWLLSIVTAGELRRPAAEASVG